MNIDGVFTFIFKTNIRLTLFDCTLQDFFFFNINTIICAMKNLDTFFGKILCGYEFSVEL